MKLRLAPDEIVELREFLDRNEKLLGYGLIIEVPEDGPAQFTLIGAGSLLTRVVGA